MLDEQYTIEVMSKKEIADALSACIDKLTDMGYDEFIGMLAIEYGLKIN
jgi:hypothetical protein